MILTSDKEWNLTVLDYEGELRNELWFDAQSSFPDRPTDKIFNKVGNYRHRSNEHELFLLMLSLLQSLTNLVCKNMKVVLFHVSSAQVVNQSVPCIFTMFALTCVLSAPNKLSCTFEKRCIPTTNQV